MNKPLHNVEAVAEPWYRNAWVWLIIAIPGMTVIACLFTIYLAIANPIELVRDPLKVETEQAVP